MDKTNILEYIENAKQFYIEKTEVEEMSEEHIEEFSRVKELEKELNWLFSEFG